MNSENIRFDWWFCSPFSLQESKRAIVVPTRVEQLHVQFWGDNRILADLPTLDGARERVKQSLSHVRQDHKRYLNPTPYKVGPFKSRKRMWFLHFAQTVFLEIVTKGIERFK